MNFKTTFFILACLFVNILYSQQLNNVTISTINGKTYKGNLSINSDDNTYIIDTKKETLYLDFDIVTDIIKNNNKFDLLKINENNYTLSQLLVDGNAMLYETYDNKFYIKSPNSNNPVLLSDNKKYTRGQLLIIFKDCGVVRDRINVSHSFNKNKLIKLTQAYNSCTLTGSIQFTNSEIKQSKQKNDSINFDIGIGLTSQNFKINNTNGNHNRVGTLIHLGMTLSPSFFGELKKNFSFKARLNHIINQEDEYSNNYITSYNLKSNQTNVLLGIEYNFLKNKKISPFISVLAGGKWTNDFLNINSTELIFNSIEYNYLVKEYDTSNVLFTSQIEAGFMYQINNKNSIRFTFAFNPSTERNAANEDLHPLPITIKEKMFLGSISFQF